MTTDANFSPHELLPAGIPRDEAYPADYFYEHVAKHLVKDTVRIMNNGLHIDLFKVQKLEEVLDKQLVEVQKALNENPLIVEFQELQKKSLIKSYIKDRKSKFRKPDYYLKPFKHSDMVHRSYFMHLFAIQQDLPLPSELLPGSQVTKWPAKLVSSYAKSRPVLQRLLAGTLSHQLIDKAMQTLAEDKAATYNKSYQEQIASPPIETPEFNPGSSKQKQELFAWLDLESDKTSATTGLPSFDRSQVERINKETADENIRLITQAFIDHSFAAIVRNNFINAFYRYTVDNRLHGQYKLLGAKTGRYTSSNP